MAHSWLQRRQNLISYKHAKILKSFLYIEYTIILIYRQGSFKYFQNLQTSKKKSSNFLNSLNSLRLPICPAGLAFIISNSSFISQIYNWSQKHLNFRKSGIIPIFNGNKTSFEIDFYKSIESAKICPLGDYILYDIFSA